MSPSQEPNKPPEGKRPWIERVVQPEINDRPGDAEAELDRYVAGTERAQTETALLELQVKMSVEIEKERALVDLRIREKDTDTKLRNDEKRTNGEVDDNAARAIADVTKAEADATKTTAEAKQIEAVTIGIKRRDRATEIERYTFTGLTVLGFLAAIILAFTSGNPFGSLGSFAVSGVSGVRLSFINRALARAEREEKQREKEGSGSGDA